MQIKFKKGMSVDAFMKTLSQLFPNDEMKNYPTLKNGGTLYLTVNQLPPTSSALRGGRIFAAKRFSFRCCFEKLKK